MYGLTRIMINIIPESLISQQVGFPIVVLLIAYTFCGVIYRLYLSPIAKFPGPRLAAVSLWYEFYYDVIKGGQYTWKIAELHKQYGIWRKPKESKSLIHGSLGPVIRINPYELHINEPSFYDDLYVGPTKRKTEKFWYSVRHWDRYI